VLEVERSLRTSVPLGMLMVDVDHFRLYNNRFGHPTGDEVLRRVARLIGEHRRVNDVVARYGGEEFALLLINADHKVAAHIGERLRARISAEHFPQAEELPGGALTISVGVASCPADGTTPSGLLAAADAALYRAKNAGRNTLRVAGETTEPPRMPDLLKVAGHSLPDKW
jgi:diguanylate cyclase (GGDEF)-like protein